MRWLDWFGDGTLHVLEIGLACCSLEVEAASLSAAALPGELPSGARVAVTGTTTARRRSTLVTCPTPAIVGSRRGDSVRRG